MARRRMVIGLGALALTTLVVAMAVGSEVPLWRPGGTHSVAVKSVARGADALACPAPGAQVAIFGDSHVAGQGLARAGGEAFGKVLEARLGRGAKVALHGFGGDTAPMGAQRWRRARSDAATIIIAYGTNDAAPRGWLSDRVQVPLADYTAALARLVERWRGGGRTVILLAPPPGGSVAITQRLAPYRAAMRKVAGTLGVAVIDPADAFAACPGAQPVLALDALHLNADGHRCLGEWLAQALCPAKR